MWNLHSITKSHGKLSKEGTLEWLNIGSSGMISVTRKTSWMLVDGEVTSCVGISKSPIVIRASSYLIPNRCPNTFISKKENNII